jgi:EAL domain-containing protein (putative c-di-GMP-specific phosphodiesterase class I)
MEADLREAITHQQFSLHYQAQVDFAGNILGAEALLRWKHHQRGDISPTEFIPFAEECGLIIPIGRWVLQAACAQIKAWEDHPVASQLQLAVNVSARQFMQTDFVEDVILQLQASGADPGRLKFELTESALIDGIDEVIDKMRLLKAVGIHFSLDDFGTGYSSLSYLRRLPLDQLKIDRSFVTDITTNNSDAVIAQTIIGMARNLRLGVIAEGVETKEQLDLLERQGCLGFQGFLFSRPVPLDEFEQLLSRPKQPIY